MSWFQVSATILPLLTFISKNNSPLKRISYTKENKGTYSTLAPEKYNWSSRASIVCIYPDTGNHAPQKKANIAKENEVQLILLLFSFAIFFLHQLVTLVLDEILSYQQYSFQLTRMCFALWDSLGISFFFPEWISQQTTSLILYILNCKLLTGLA